MKINQTTRIVGEKVILVPYRKHHVLKYHDWMSIPEIQELTASEPLSLDEEYQMQLNWIVDDNKLTFIVLRRDLYESLHKEDNIEKEKLSMIGDVNAFISTESIEDENDDLKNKSHLTAELEIMIAEIENRGHGFGIEAVYLMINYCVQNIVNPSISHFHVKINEDNIASIKMFERLGFEKYKYVKVFKEQCLKLEVNNLNFQGESENRKLIFFNKYPKSFMPKIDVNY